MSWSRFQIVRIVEHSQHTSMSLRIEMLYSALEGITAISALQASASFEGLVTRGDALRACPWLSYSAPLALVAQT